MKANNEPARRGALDLLKCIKELQELIPQLVEKYSELETRVQILENAVNK